MINIIEKFKKLMNTRVNYKFGFFCGCLLLMGSILSIFFSILAKFFYATFMEDFWWKFFEQIFYLGISIWIIIIYMQPDYVEEEIKVYEVESKFGGNK